MSLEFAIVPLPSGDTGVRRMVATDLAGHRGVVIFRGFNISGHCKLDGLPCRSTAVAEALFARLAGDGYNLVRLPVIWEKLTDGVATRLVEFVDAAARHGLFVLVDLHQDLLGSAFRVDNTEYHGTGFPADVLEAAYEATAPSTAWKDATWKAFYTWQENYKKNEQLKRCFKGLHTQGKRLTAFAKRVADLFADRPNVIGFEVLNEPMDPLVGDAYHRYYEVVASALPRNKAFAMPKGDWLYAYPAGLPAFHSNVDQIDAGLDPSALPGLQLSTPHIYAPLEMARLPFYRPPSHVVPMVVEWHRRNGHLPFIVGEFGVPADLHHAAGHLATWVDHFEQHAVSWCLWNLNPEADASGNDRWCGEHMSVAAKGAGDSTVLTDRYNAVLRPFVTLASGDITDLSYRHGWTFSVTIAKAIAPGLVTKIVVPPSLGDFDVHRFTGSTHRKHGNTVTFSTDDGPETIELIKHEAPEARS